MLARAMVRLLGSVTPMTAAIREYTNRVITDVTGDNQTLPVAGIIGGTINRVVTTANTTDVFPSADTIIAALPEMCTGDSFEFDIRMNLAHTNTLTLGTGVTSAGTVGIVASNVRTYMLTLLSGNSRSASISGTTTNASKVISNVAAATLAAMSVGMGITGTGIPASSYVTAVNIGAGTFSINADATATGDAIVLAVFPRFTLTGIRTSAI